MNRLPAWTAGSRPCARAGRTLSLVALGILLTLWASAPAAGTNAALNPGFEVVCGLADACGWPPNSTLEGRDTSYANSGSASYRIDIPAGFNEAASVSNCVDGASFAPSGFSFGFAYRTKDAEITDMTMILSFYTNDNCTGVQANYFINQPPTTDGSWHTVVDSSQTLNVAFAAYTVQIGPDCGPSPCPNAVSSNYDDLIVQQTPTAVTLAGFAASRTAHEVELRWHTASEAELLGFNLYRAQAGRLVKLNRELIPSVFGGTTRGHAYSFLDATGLRRGWSIRYRLQAVSLNGTLTWLGSTRLR